MSDWKITKVNDYNITLESEELNINGKPLIAMVNYVGCVDFNQEGDIFHFCDIDIMIQALKDLKELGRKHIKYIDDCYY